MGPGCCFVQCPITHFPTLKLYWYMVYQRERPVTDVTGANFQK